MKARTKLLAILCFLLSLLYIAWGKWFSTSPQSLSEKPAIVVNASNDLLRGIYYDVPVPPQKTDQYLAADYRLWIPDDVSMLRGLIIKHHGCGDEAAATGLEYANDLQWQALALKHQFAILGARLPTGDLPCEYWALINYGSGPAFLNALHSLAQESNHPELEALPWVLWGHSGGADWSTQMLQEYPDRTIAAIGVRGGGFFLLGENPTLTGIPVLFASGENDPYGHETLDMPRRVFLRYRKSNALWALAIEANAGHECGDTRFLAIPYLDAIIPMRIALPGQPLNPIEPSVGWLGNLVNHEIASLNRYEGNALEAVWLPNEETARKWQEYGRNGQISPTHEPTAPTDVRALKNTETTATITWNFTPDLENGLPSFRIYRNEALIATIKGQGYNFSDAPEPANIVLEFVDKNARTNSTYTVSAFNALGESVSDATQ